MNSLQMKIWLVNTDSDSDTCIIYLPAWFYLHAVTEG